MNANRDGMKTGKGLGVCVTAVWFASMGLVFSAATWAATPSDARRPWTGEVTYVTDGDTLWVRPEAGSPPRKLRLDGIDAPEICQAYGVAAREALMQRVLHRQVSISTRATDDYQRLLVTVWLDGEDLGGWMVAQGHAWSYRYRRNAGPYATEEKTARRASRGLFADSEAERPRDFRQRHGSCHTPQH